MSKIGVEVIYLMGYLTEAQWKDAYKMNNLNAKTLDKYREAVEHYYDMEIDITEEK